MSTMSAFPLYFLLRRWLNGTIGRCQRSGSGSIPDRRIVLIFKKALKRTSRFNRFRCPDGVARPIIQAFRAWDVGSNPARGTILNGSDIIMKRSSRRWKKKGQMRWKWQRKKMRKEKRRRLKK